MTASNPINQNWSCDLISFFIEATFCQRLSCLRPQVQVCVQGKSLTRADPLYRRFVPGAPCLLKTQFRLFPVLLFAFFCCANSLSALREKWVICITNRSMSAPYFCSG